MVVSKKRREKDEDVAPAPTAEQRSAMRRTIWHLAGPMIVVEVLMSLETLGVVAIIGRMPGQALYVRSVYLPVALVYLALNTGLLTSNQVASALIRGREQPSQVAPTMVSMARIWLLLGLALFAGLAVCAPGLATLLHVAGQARGQFVWFIRATSLANLAFTGPGLCASSLRGYGYTRSGSAVLLVNAVLELVIVAGLSLGAGYGLGSVPLARVAASVVALALGFFFMRRTGLWSRHSLTRTRPPALILVRKVGLPVAASLAIISWYSLGLLWVLGRYGPDVVSGFAAALTAYNVIIVPAVMLGSATAIAMNQQWGGGRFHLSRLTLRTGLESTVALYLPIALGAWLGAGLLSEIATSVASIGQVTERYLHAVALTYVVQGPVIAALTIMEQIGGGLYAVVLNAVYFAGIIVAAALVTRVFNSPGAVFDTIAVANFAGLSVLVVVVAFVRRAQARGDADARL